MFDFTKETIINSALIDKGDGTMIPRFVADATAGSEKFTVLRVSEYKAACLSGSVYKTNPQEGVMATAELELPLVPQVYAVELTLKLSDKYLADYANANYKFQKPVYAEFEIVNGDTENLNRMIKAIQLAIPENYKFLRVEANATDDGVLVTCTDSHQLIYDAVISQYTPNSLTPSEGEFKVYSKGTITANTPEFGTSAWIQENLRFPTYYNTAYNAINKDERPVEGGLYTMYAFQYVVPRSGLTGMGSVGQVIQSSTTHVFYVLSSVVAEFETAIKAGLKVTDFQVK